MTNMDFNLDNVKLVFRVSEKCESIRDCAAYPIRAYLHGEKIGEIWVELVEKGVKLENNFYDKNNSIYIQYLEVKRDYRHNGIGRKLLRYVKDRYKKKNIYLKVGKENNIALNLYKDEGFKFIKDSEKFYGYCMILKRMI